jgi:hypothetical protein
MTRQILNRNRITFLSFIMLLSVSNITLFSIFVDNNMMPSYLDVDRKVNGNTLISTFSFREVLNYPNRMLNQIPVEPNSPDHKIFEVDQSGNKIWELIGLAQPHEIEELPDGHLLIADTGFDRLIEIDYPNKNIIWEWKPEYINWTKVNPLWNSSHYYNGPPTFDWTHLNDVEFKQYSTWNSCLISIRNFDMIVEVNYTAEKLGPSNNPNNIVWYYGDYKNHSVLNHQHNPDYLSNGNIIIADSKNNRIIEVNYTTKEVEWVYQGGLDWPRDADELPNGNILITDSLNNRVFIINKVSKEILWQFKGDLINPYEADLLENGNILIGNGIGGVVYEINGDGIIVWKYGLSYLKSVVYLNCIIAVLMSSVFLFFIYAKKDWKTEFNEKKVRFSIKTGILVSLIIISITVLLTYTSITIMVFRILFSSR